MHLIHKGSVLRKRFNGPLTRYANLQIAHVSRMPGTLSPWSTSRKPLVSDPCVHHARALMHLGIAKPRWREKRSRHSWRMRNPPFCISGKRSMPWHHCVQAKKIGWHLRPFGNSATCCQHSAMVAYISHESPRQLLHVSCNAEPILAYYDVFATTLYCQCQWLLCLKTLGPDENDHYLADVTFQMDFHAWLFLYFLRISLNK